MKQLKVALNLDFRQNCTDRFRHSFTFKTKQIVQAYCPAEQQEV